ncbi:MAG: homoserine dehydrogenase [Dehalococcoidia bacterium]|nr:homoserine dehydrogenase [Dehalococcoidia bacterium]MDD5493417.1 homoserine dehydrogenase [Dehalococcoidia bacterium]
MIKKRPINVGLMGIGTIGSGVARAITGKKKALARQAGSPLVLKAVLEKDISRHGILGIDKDIFLTDFDKFISRDDIDIVIELIGGEYPAYDYVKKSLISGKHVVTANKELMAKHGAELLTIAHEHHAGLRFEASVGGGIPLISPFQRDLVANDIQAIYAILNGTTNYILSRMAHDNLDFSVALKQAQKLGYAEANPANDISGLDAAYKLGILTSLAFDMAANFNQIYFEGISRLKPRDFRYASELGYAIKLLAIAKQSNNGVEARVHPVLIPAESLLAKVDGVYNAIYVSGDLVGNVLFYGQGAGPSATSSAIIADVINIALNINTKRDNAPRFIPVNTSGIKPMSDIESRYYFRMSVLDQAGVLAQISTAMGNQSISISSVIQKESDPSNKTAEIVIMTHYAKESAVQKAMKTINKLTVVKEISNFIRVEAFQI